MLSFVCFISFVSVFVCYCLFLVSGLAFLEVLRVSVVCLLLSKQILTSLSVIVRLSFLNSIQFPFEFYLQSYVQRNFHFKSVLQYEL